jgi:hypothetical protein
MFYTSLYSGVISIIPTTISSSGAFTYTISGSNNTTLPGVSISLGDAATLSTSYLQTNVITINANAGLINANLTTQAYAIFNQPTTVTINLPRWNQSYPTSMYVYLFGTIINSNQQVINTNGVYSISFTTTIPTGAVTQ